MRSTLNARQWARLRAYVNGLDANAKKDLLHRCENWEKSVAIELGQIAVGGEPSKFRKAQALQRDLVSQVVSWLKK